MVHGSPLIRNLLSISKDVWVRNQYLKGMTTPENSQDLSGTNTLDIFNQVIEIATNAGLDASLTDIWDEDPGSEPDFVAVVFPDGAKGRRIIFDAEDAQVLINQNFQNFRFVPDLEATLNSKLDIIEAIIEPISDSNVSTPIWRLPGAEIIEAGKKLVKGSESDMEAISEGTLDRPNKWKLFVSEGLKSIEISPISNAFLFQRLPRPGTLTIKLTGYQVSDLEEATELLQSIANAFLFELDVVHGVSMGLRRYRPIKFRRRVAPGEKDVAYPRNKYSNEALTLYQYGRSSRQLPLNQFLAYYQSLEYFFPIFARAETVTNVRTALLDPRLNPTKDEDVNRVISISLAEVKVSQRERDQLRATINGCTTESELKVFIESSKGFRDHFCSNKQSISKELKIIMEDNQRSLTDQVADRIYRIRCRVVHTKQDGNGEDGELLLPFSPEVETLKIDIELLKFLAQRALIAKAIRKPL